MIFASSYCLQMLAFRICRQDHSVLIDLWSDILPPLSSRLKWGLLVRLPRWAKHSRAIPVCPTVLFVWYLLWCFSLFLIWSRIFSALPGRYWPPHFHHGPSGFRSCKDIPDLPVSDHVLFSTTAACSGTWIPAVDADKLLPFPFQFILQKICEHSPAVVMNTFFQKWCSPAHRLQIQIFDTYDIIEIGYLSDSLCR